MLRLYNFQDSGNSYKVRQLLTQLGLEFERIDIDLVGGETQTARYRDRNPLGQTPFIEFDDGRTLAESNAILWHLAEGTPYFPEGSWAQAQALQWMSFEQYRIEPTIGTVRFWTQLLKVADQRREIVTQKLGIAKAALGILDRHLEAHPFVAGERYGIADISLYAYVHLAEEAGVSLAPCPAIVRWFERVKSQSKHITFTADVGRVIPWPEARTS
jgi:glutathione S-transferase